MEFFSGSPQRCSTTVLEESSLRVLHHIATVRNGEGKLIYKYKIRKVVADNQCPRIIGTTHRVLTHAGVTISHT